MKLTDLDNSQDDKGEENPLSGLLVYKKRPTKRPCSFVGSSGIWLLSDDMMIEILSRLPIELVPEIKHVCKWWRHLATHHSFRNIQFQRCQKAISGIFIQGPAYNLDYIAIGKEGKHKVNKKRLDFLPEKVVVTASSNGLLVCQSLFQQRWGHLNGPMIPFPPDEELVIYVCNPLTKEFSTLKPNISNWQHCGIGLAFNSFDSLPTCFDLVVLQYPLTGKSWSWYAFKIFSSKTNEWRISTDLCYCSHEIVFDQHVFSNGIFYWLTAGGTVLTFDLKTEKSDFIELPQQHRVLLTKTKNGMCLGVSRGYIHYTTVSRNEFRVWILNSDTNSKSEWQLKYFGRVWSRWKPMLVDPANWNEEALSYGDRIGNSEIELLSFKDDVVFMKHGHDFCEYDLKTDNLKEICSFGALSGSALHGRTVLTYSMSLLPVCNS